MLEIYICEDNAKQLESISKFISDYCIMESLDAAVSLAAPSPVEVLNHFKDCKNPALFFLDIDLKAKYSGIELARRIREYDNQGRKVFIVFLTSHTEMTLMTFQYKVEALDFIAKDNADIVKNKIKECIHIALKRHVGSEAKTIKIKANDTIIILDMDEIIFIESTHIRHKLRLHTKSRALEFNSELKTMHELLDKRFIRCHRTCIVNKDKIKAINNSDNTITMSNNGVCPVSRNGKKFLM